MLRTAIVTGASSLRASALASQGPSSISVITRCRGFAADSPVFPLSPAWIEALAPNGKLALVEGNIGQVQTAMRVAETAISGIRLHRCRSRQCRHLPYEAVYRLYAR